MQRSDFKMSPDAAWWAVNNTREQYQAIEDKSSVEAFECRKILEAWESRKKKIDATLEARGKRYEGCTLENYKVHSQLQQKVVDAVWDYAVSKSTQNLMLIGPMGTGKDHLLTALSKLVFMESGLVTHWANGVDLHEQFHRELMNGSQYRIIDPLASSDVLYLSDPVPPTGSLSESKQSAMLRVIDDRYSQCMPTWASLNVLNGAEAEARMGAQAVDRLRDGALVLFCNWASYRKAAT
jgi:DNA replication protein DnaC